MRAGSQTWRPYRPAPSVHDRPEYPSQPELAVAALLRLLSRYPATRTPAVAHAIVAHLHTVGDDPRLAQSLRDCAHDLVADWEAFVALSGDADAAVSRSRLS